MVGEGADDLGKLYGSVSKEFEVGDEAAFRQKMATPEDRKKFYDVASQNGIDLGDYNEYETRLAGTSKKKVPAEPSATSTPVSPAVGQQQEQSSESNGLFSNIAKQLKSYLPSAPATFKSDSEAEVIVSGATEETSATRAKNKFLSENPKSELTGGYKDLERLKEKSISKGAQDLADYGVSQANAKFALQPIIETVAQPQIKKYGELKQREANGENVSAEMDALLKQPYSEYKMEFAGDRGQSQHLPTVSLKTDGTVADALEKLKADTAKYDLLAEVADAKQVKLNEDVQKLRKLTGFETTKDDKREMGYVETAFDAFQSTVESGLNAVPLALANDTEYVKMMREASFMRDVVQPKERPEGALGWSAEMGGGIAPYVLGTAPAALAKGVIGRTIASASLNSFMMSATDSYNQAVSAWQQAKAEGKSDEEALAISRSMEKVGAVSGAVTGAALSTVPNFIGTGNKLAKGSLQKLFADEALKGTFVGGLFAGKTATENAIAKQYGLDRDVLEGTNESFWTGVGLHLAMDIAFGRSGGALKEKARNTLSKHGLAISQQAIDNAVKEGITNYHEGEVLKRDLIERARVMKNVPDNLTPDEMLAIYPLAKQEIDLRDQLEKVGEGFGIEAQIEEVQRKKAELLGAPLTEKERGEMVKLEEKKADKEGEGLNEVESETLRHLVSRDKSRAIATTALKNPIRVQDKNGKRGLLRLDEEGNIEFLPDGTGAARVYEKGETTKGKTLRDLGFFPMGEDRMTTATSQITSGSLEVGATVTFRGREYEITANKNAPDGFKTNADGEVTVIYLKDKDGNKFPVGASDEAGRNLIEDANRYVSKKEAPKAEPAKAEIPKIEAPKVEVEQAEITRKNQPQETGSGVGGDVETTTNVLNETQKNNPTVWQKIKDAFYSVVGKVHEGFKNTQDFIDNAINSDTPFSELAKALKDKLGDIKTSFVDDLRNKEGKLAYGKHNKDGITVSRKSPHPLQTWFHEAVHKLTVDKLYDYEEGSLHKLSDKDIEAIQNLHRIFGKVQKIINDKGIETKQYNPFKNVREFVAEALTNPEFQDILNKFKGEGKSPTLLKQFLDAVSKLLGLKDGSILDDVFHHTENLFNEGKSEQKNIAESYHDAKSKGIENDFVKAVEQSLPTQEESSGKEVGSGVGGDNNDGTVFKSTTKEKDGVTITNYEGYRKSDNKQVSLSGRKLTKDAFLSEYKVDEDALDLLDGVEKIVVRQVRDRNGKLVISVRLRFKEGWMDAEIKAEQSLPTQEAKAKANVPEALRDVESTAKALGSIDKEHLPLARNIADNIVKEYESANKEIERLNKEKNNLSAQQKEDIIKKTKYKKSEKYPDKYEYNTGSSITRKTEQQLIDDYYENKIKKIRKDKPSEGVLNIYRKQDKDYSTPQKVSEAYHKAKSDGSNPELVKAVESLLSKKQSEGGTTAEVTRTETEGGEKLVEVEGEVVEPIAEDIVVEETPVVEEKVEVVEAKPETVEQSQFSETEAGEVKMANGNVVKSEPATMPDGEAGLSITIEKADGTTIKVGKVYAEDAAKEVNKKLRGLELGKKKAAPTEEKSEEKADPQVGTEVEFTHAGNKKRGEVVSVNEDGSLNIKSKGANFKKGAGEVKPISDERASTLNAYEDIAGLTPNQQTGRVPVAPIIGGKPKPLGKIIFDVTKGVKQKLFYAKPAGNRPAAGTYSPSNSAVHIKYQGDLNTTAHEIGHSIDDMFGLLSDLKTTPNPTMEAELMKFAPFGSKPPSGHPNARMYELGEGFAEWLRAYIVNPQAAIAEAPTVYAEYQSKVHSEYQKALDQFSTDVRTFAGATGRDQVLANVEWKPEEKQGIIGEMFSRSKPDNMFALTWVDRVAAVATNPLRAFNKAIEYAKGIRGIDELLPAEDPELLARLLLGSDGKTSSILEDGMISADGKPLQDANGNAKNLKWLLEPLNNTDVASMEKDMQDVASYMIAERTVELAGKVGRESLLSGIGGGLYKDVDVARKALQEFTNGDPQKLARIQEAADRYRELSDDVLKYMVDKGRMSQEQYDAIKANNLQYVAMHRVMETAPEEAFEAFRGGGKSLGSKTEVAHSIKGSTRKIQNPYISLLDAVSKGVKEADRNEAMVAFRDLLVEPRQMYEGAPNPFAEIGVIAKEGDKETIPVFVDGKLERWKFQSDVYKALKGLDDEGWKIPWLASAPAKLLRATVTKFPVFAMKNIVRDVQSRMILSDQNSLKNAGGLRDLVGDKEHWKELARSGGLNSGYYLKDKVHYNGLMEEAVHEMVKNKKTIIADPVRLKKLWHGYENILGKSETVNRVAEYRAAFRNAKAKGMDDYNAMLFAGMKSRDLMDFALMGRWMRVVNQLIPFSNAAVQGLRSAGVSAKQNPQGFAARVALFSMLPAVAEWLWNHKDEETAKQYEELPTYQRDMFHNYKIGDDKWLAVPKPFELALPAAGISRAMSYSVGNEKAFDGYAGNVFKSMSPIDEGSVLGPLQTFGELGANYSYFREKPIIPQYEKPLDVTLRKRAKEASRFGQAIQDLAGVDGRNIDHLMRSQMSYVGNAILKTSDIGRDDKRSFDLTDLGFFKSSPAYSSKSVKGFIEYATRWGLTNSGDYEGFKSLVTDYFDAKTDAQREKISKTMTQYAKTHLEVWEKSKVGQSGKSTTSITPPRPK